MPDQTMLSHLFENRETFYRFLGRFFEREADRAFLTQLPAIRFPDYRDVPEAEKLQTAAEHLASWVSQDPLPDSEDMLAADYARTFLAAGIAKGEAAFPFESVYTGKGGLIMQDAWEDLKKKYRECGIKKSPAAKDLEIDHITMELEYMAYSCHLAANAQDAVAYLRDQLNFLEHHLLNWVGRFNADIHRFALTSFYPIAGDLLEGYLTFDRLILKSLL